MNTVSIRNQSRNAAILVNAHWCQSYLCRLRGLTFQRSLPDGQGLLLVNPTEGRISASIHMWMVFFPLGVVWIDGQGKVVDKVEALPWRIYFPKHAARYIIEASPAILSHVELGDQMAWSDDPET